MFSDTAGAAPFLAPDVSVPEPHFDLPSEFGRVEHRDLASKPGAPVFFHILDAHGNVSAQKSIQKILQYLHSRKPVTLLLEGGVAEINPELLSVFPDRNQDMEAAQTLLGQGAYDGPGLFLLENWHAGAAPIPAFGIEEPSFYIRNLELYRNIKLHRQTIQREFISIEESLLTAASKILNPELLKFFKYWLESQQENAEISGFLPELQRQALIQFEMDLENPRSQASWPQIVRLLRIRAMEGQVDLSAAAAEFAALEKDFSAAREFAALRPGTGETIPADGSLRKEAERFFDRAGPEGFRFENYPAWSKWLGFRILERELDAAQLFEEINRLHEKIFGRLVQTAGEERFLSQYRIFQELKKTVGLELTRPEYKRVAENLKSVRPSQWAGVMQSLDPEFPAISGTLEESFERALRFYEVAEARDEKMFRNIRRYISGTNPVAVVSGGFHGEGLRELCRREGITYVSILPHIQDLESSEAYEKTMLLESDALAQRSGVDIPQAGDTAMPRFLPEYWRQLSNLQGLARTAVMRKQTDSRSEQRMMFGLHMELQPQMSLAAELKPQQKAKLETLMNLQLLLQDSHGEIPSAAHGIEALKEADRILSERNAVGVVAGSVIKSLWSTDSEPDIDQHKDIDVLVLSPNFTLQQPFEGGIDWFLPEERRLEIVSGKGHSSINKTVRYWVNGNGVFMRAGIVPDDQVHKMTRGLWIADVDFYKQLTEAVALNYFNPDVTDFDDEVLAAFRQELEGVLSEMLHPVWKKFTGANNPRLFAYNMLEIDPQFDFDTARTLQAFLADAGQRQYETLLDQLAAQTEKTSEQVAAEIKTAADAARFKQHPDDEDLHEKSETRQEMRSSDMLSQIRGIASTHFDPARRETHDYLVNFIRQAGNVLDLLGPRERSAFRQRWKLIAKDDGHARERWARDAAWLAAFELAKETPGMISRERLLDALAGVISPDVFNSTETAAALDASWLDVRKQLESAKAIQVYDREVRLDPLSGNFLIRKITNRAALEIQPLVVRGPPKVVLSVLVRNRWEKIDAFLNSIAEIETPNVELIILDNASTSADMRKIENFREKSRIPVTVIGSRTNLGFDEGHNVIADIALDKIQTDYLFMLNDDVVVDKDFVTEMLRFYENTTEPAGFAGPAVYDLEDGRKTDQLQHFGGRYPGNALFRKSGYAEDYKGQPLPESLAVDYVIGPVQTFSAAALRLTGVYDARFFAYNEELDLGLRLDQAGYGSFVVSGARVWHSGAETSGGKVSPFVVLQGIKNDFLLLAKHPFLRKPRSLARILMSAVFLSLKSLNEFLKTRDYRQLAAVLTGYFHGIGGHFPVIDSDWNFERGGLAVMESPAAEAVTMNVLDALRSELEAKYGEGMVLVSPYKAEGENPDQIRVRVRVSPRNVQETIDFLNERFNAFTELYSQYKWAENGQPRATMQGDALLFFPVDLRLDLRSEQRTEELAVLLNRSHRGEDLIFVNAAGDRDQGRLLFAGRSDQLWLAFLEGRQFGTPLNDAAAVYEGDELIWHRSGLPADTAFNAWARAGEGEARIRSLEGEDFRLVYRDLGESGGIKQSSHLLTLYRGETEIAYLTGRRSRVTGRMLVRIPAAQEEAAGQPAQSFYLDRLYSENYQKLDALLFYALIKISRGLALKEVTVSGNAGIKNVREFGALLDVSTDSYVYHLDSPRFFARQTDRSIEQNAPRIRARSEQRIRHTVFTPDINIAAPDLGIDTAEEGAARTENEQLLLQQALLGGGILPQMAVKSGEVILSGKARGVQELSEVVALLIEAADIPLTSIEAGRDVLTAKPITEGYATSSEPLAWLTGVLERYIAAGDYEIEWQFNNAGQLMLKRSEQRVQRSEDPVETLSEIKARLEGLIKQYYQEAVDINGDLMLIPGPDVGGDILVSEQASEDVDKAEFSAHEHARAYLDAVRTQHRVLDALAGWFGDQPGGLIVQSFNRNQAGFIQLVSDMFTLMDPVIYVVEDAFNLNVFKHEAINRLLVEDPAQLGQIFTDLTTGSLSDAKKLNPDYLHAETPGESTDEEKIRLFAHSLFKNLEDDVTRIRLNNDLEDWHDLITADLDFELTVKNLMWAALQRGEDQAEAAVKYYFVEHQLRPYSFLATLNLLQQMPLEKIHPENIFHTTNAAIAKILPLYPKLIYLKFLSERLGVDLSNPLSMNDLNKPVFVEIFSALYTPEGLERSEQRGVETVSEIRAALAGLIPAYFKLIVNDYGRTLVMPSSPDDDEYFTALLEETILGSDSETGYKSAGEAYADIRKDLNRILDKFEEWFGGQVSGEIVQSFNGDRDGFMKMLAVIYPMQESILAEVDKAFDFDLFKQEELRDLLVEDPVFLGEMFAAMAVTPLDEIAQAYQTYFQVSAGTINRGREKLLLFLDDFFSRLPKVLEDISGNFNFHAWPELIREDLTREEVSRGIIWISGGPENEEGLKKRITSITLNWNIRPHVVLASLSALSQLPLEQIDPQNFKTIISSGNFRQELYAAVVYLRMLVEDKGLDLSTSLSAEAINRPEWFEEFFERYDEDGLSRSEQRLVQDRDYNAQLSFYEHHTDLHDYQPVDLMETMEWLMKTRYFLNDHSLSFLMAALLVKKDLPEGERKLFWRRSAGAYQFYLRTAILQEYQPLDLQSTLDWLVEHREELGGNSLRYLIEMFILTGKLPAGENPQEWRRAASALDFYFRHEKLQEYKAQDLKSTLLWLEGIRGDLVVDEEDEAESVESEDLKGLPNLVKGLALARKLPEGIDVQTWIRTAGARDFYLRSPLLQQYKPATVEEAVRWLDGYRDELEGMSLSYGMQALAIGGNLPENASESNWWRTAAAYEFYLGSKLLQSYRPENLKATLDWLVEHREELGGNSLSYLMQAFVIAGTLPKSANEVVWIRKAGSYDFYLNSPLLQSYEPEDVRETLNWLHAHRAELNNNALGTLIAALAIAGKLPEPPTERYWTIKAGAYDRAVNADDRAVIESEIRRIWSSGAGAGNYRSDTGRLQGEFNADLLLSKVDGEVLSRDYRDEIMRVAYDLYGKAMIEGFAGPKEGIEYPGDEAFDVLLEKHLARTVPVSQEIGSTPSTISRWIHERKQRDPAFTVFVDGLIVRRKDEPVERKAPAKDPGKAKLRTLIRKHGGVYKLIADALDATPGGVKGWIKKHGLEEAAAQAKEEKKQRKNEERSEQRSNQDDYFDLLGRSEEAVLAVAHAAEKIIGDEHRVQEAVFKSLLDKLAPVLAEEAQIDLDAFREEVEERIASLERLLADNTLRFEGGGAVILTTAGSFESRRNLLLGAVPFFVALAGKNGNEIFMTGENADALKKAVFARDNGLSAEEKNSVSRILKFAVNPAEDAAAILEKQIRENRSAAASLTAEESQVLGAAFHAILKAIEEPADLGAENLSLLDQSEAYAARALLLLDLARHLQLNAETIKDQPEAALRLVGDYLRERLPDVSFEIFADGSFSLSLSSVAAQLAVFRAAAESFAQSA